MTDLGKITGSHLRRGAVVYLRQSTLTQVERNRESTARQYNLVERAVGLGWPHPRVTVIDADLGVSGASTAGRCGFAELTAQVGLGEVGIVLALEVSRLARNNADWYRLLDLAGMTDTLIADADGVYHPVVVVGRVIDAVDVRQHRARQGTQLDQLIPVTARAGQPGHLNAQYQPHVVQADLADQPLETRPGHGGRPRSTEVLVDHQDSVRLPAQPDRPVHQGILQPRRLLMVQDLLPGGLAHIDHRETLHVTVDHLAARLLPGHHHRHGRYRSPAAIAIARLASRTRCRTAASRFTSGSRSHTPRPLPPAPASGADSTLVAHTASFPSEGRSRSATLASRNRPSRPIIGICSPLQPSIGAVCLGDGTYPGLDHAAPPPGPRLRDLARQLRSHDLYCLDRQHR